MRLAATRSQDLIEAARRGNVPAARRLFYRREHAAFRAKKVINAPHCAYVERESGGQAYSGGANRHIRPESARLDKTPQILRAKI